MYAVSVWALLLRQRKRMKPKAEITRVFLRSPLSIFCLFSKGMPPNQGQQLPIRLLSFGPRPIFNHRRYLYICSLLHFLQTTLWEFLQCHAEGWVWEGDGVKGVSPLIDVGDITYHVFFPQVNNISVALMKRLYNEVRSASCPGRGVYCQIQTTPYFRLFLSFECRKKENVSAVLGDFQC